MFVQLANELKNNKLVNFVKNKILENQISKQESLTQTNIFRNIKWVNVKIITTDNVEIKGWLLGPSKVNNKTKVVFVMHGNKDNRETFCRRYDIEAKIEDNNLVVFIIDYRDFGDSKGVFTVQGANLDVLASLEFVAQYLGVSEIDIIAVSLGSGILCEYIANIGSNKIHDTEVSSDNTLNDKVTERINEILDNREDITFQSNNQKRAAVRKVCLISPIKSIYDAVKHNSKLYRISCYTIPFFNKLLIRKFAYDNTNKIKLIDPSNLIIYHGDRDTLIPLCQIENMIKNSKIELRVVLDKNHSTAIKCNDVWADIGCFLRK